MKDVEEKKNENNVLIESNVAITKTKFPFPIKNNPFEKTKKACESGVCADAAENKSIKYICKCKKFRLFTPQCSNRTCVGVIPSPLENTLMKASCVCKKSSKLLGNHQVCEGGQCQRARDSNKEDFLCKCLPEVKCEKKTCEKDTSFQGLPQGVHKKSKAKCKCGLK